MTTVSRRRRLIPQREVQSLLSLINQNGLTIFAIDVRDDGVTFSLQDSGCPEPARRPSTAEEGYERWKRQQAAKARAQQANFAKAACDARPAHR